MIKVTLETYPRGRQMIEIIGLEPGVRAMETQAAVDLARKIIEAVRVIECDYKNTQYVYGCKDCPYLNCPIFGIGELMKG
jgi:hypothetical protein